MLITISDNDIPVTINAQPRHPITLSSMLTDTNNHATPELTSHQTITGTKCVVQNTPPSVDKNSELEHADNERGGKKVTDFTTDSYCPYSHYSVKWLWRAHEGPNTSTTNQKK
ncbi:hypothetical protein PAXRUDRAFT_179466 [Paxillus rubicundulus Ve08.2h10]|uniref:Uncharacterized protein n=1 Tax=Paxillus rubicundulus Ve08.2h10 TaxID=930991 RepID=A0A0D0D7R7_9AGAM|nr:hypothetical protein PAXRUDRAFT_179466 [Paxillus rubicundulus Ve08.2h10]